MKDHVRLVNDGFVSIQSCIFSWASTLRLAQLYSGITSATKKMESKD